MDSGQTEFFYSLTPDRILDAVESVGLRCTGRVLALNSMENRVYEVEIENANAATPSDRFKVVKFYRPLRWSREEILAEHQFLLECRQQEINVVEPVLDDGGESLRELDGDGIFFAVFAKHGGRLVDELTDDQLERLGYVLGRLHNVGAAHDASARPKLTVQYYALDPLQYLRENDLIPPNFVDRYRKLVEEICEFAEPLFEKSSFQRIHGDCHVGNIVWRDDNPTMMDFDDFLHGPPVQDFWLLLPGRVSAAERELDILLNAYEQLRPFDRGTLSLVEPLRALRMIRFTGWIAKRRDDPAFTRVFEDFGSERYWGEQIVALDEQLTVMRSVFGYSY